MKSKESKLIATAIESVIKSRNYGYDKVKVNLSLEIKKEETESYIYINLKGFEAAVIALNLKSIFSAIYSVQINSNENVNISIFKNA
tara:strand:+ start:1085 stop:1345 length:261 start_codon:yes stop_codon:yes gene_type:complete